MIGWWCGDTLPFGRICPGLRVGDWTVAALFARPHGWCDSPSAEAGRLAEDLVAATLGLAGAQVRVAALLPSGRPVARITGRERSPSVSLSHVHGLLGAAVAADGQVGLDIVDPADAGRALDAFFSPDELALVPDDDGLLRARLWAAKEAAYKAARLDAEFRPRRVTIEGLSPSGFAWVVRDRHVVVRGAGRFATVGRHVVAIAATGAAAAASAGPDARGVLEAAACS
jgi:hypothetical protein